MLLVRTPTERLPIPIHALAELVEDRADVLFVLGALFCARLEHLAEQVVIRVFRPTALTRFGLPSARFGDRRPIGLASGLTASLAATLRTLQHLLEDPAERVLPPGILVRILLPLLRLRFGPALPRLLPAGHAGD